MKKLTLILISLFVSLSFNTTAKADRSLGLFDPYFGIGFDDKLFDPVKSFSIGIEDLADPIEPGAEFEYKRIYAKDNAGNIGTYKSYNANLSLSIRPPKFPLDLYTKAGFGVGDCASVSVGGGIGLLDLVQVDVSKTFILNSDLKSDTTFMLKFHIPLIAPFIPFVLMSFN